MPDERRQGADEGTAAFDAVVVGAGFAGLYMLHRLRGLGLRARLYERAGGVGGTWYWNRYPGARCDVESLAYSYSFDEDLQRHWIWTQRYAPQAEILDYLNHVADRFDLRPDIQLETSVRKAAYDEETAAWTIETDRGAAVTARYLIMAVGCLSDAQVPPITGLDSFAGDWYHTAAWPQAGVDFTTKRVAVIGTGSSGVQSIPIIASHAAHTYVLQRTPQFSIPAHNAPLAPAVLRRTQENYAELRDRIRASTFHIPYIPKDHGALDASPEEFLAAVEEKWSEGGLNMLMVYPDQILSEEAAERIASVVRQKLRARINDPAIAEKLIPTTYPFGAKRLCVDSGYFETYNRDNVTLIDLREGPIEEIVPEGIRTARATLEVDTIVFATGFDAMTGSILKVDLRGRGGLTMKQKWAAGPRTYLGLSVGGFPNLFTITGPGSPSVLANMVPTIEQHVDWIADCLSHLVDNGIAAIEATPEAETGWTAMVEALGALTIFPKANSWYMGRNIAGKAEGFMPFAGGTILYRQTCDAVAANGYTGFTLTERGS